METNQHNAWGFTYLQLLIAQCLFLLFMTAGFQVFQLCTAQSDSSKFDQTSFVSFCFVLRLYMWAGIFFPFISIQT